MIIDISQPYFHLILAISSEKIVIESEFSSLEVKKKEKLKDSFLSFGTLRKSLRSRTNVC